MSLENRRLKVLEAIVDIYIQTGEPVSSKAVCDFLDISVSPATIRNDMSLLEDMGFLEQPHTSAGRIPSQLGYRKYINNLKHQDFLHISNIDKELINRGLSSAYDPEHLLEEASQVLAEITRFIAISTAPPEDNSVIRKIDFVQTGRFNAMIVIITSTGLIKNKLFRSNYEITNDILKLFYCITNDKFVGVPVASITLEFINKILLTLDEISDLILPVFESILLSSKEIMSASINLDGQNNLLFSQNFDVDDTRKIIEFLSDRDEIIKLIFQDKGSKTNVMVGLESERPELADSSIIVSRYSISGKEAGAIAIIGPTRMNYRRAITNLEYITRTVGKLLSNILDT